MDTVIFETAGALYALTAQNVPEVLDPLQVTMLPFVPEYVDGLINVAGRVMVQIDLGMRLGVAKRLEGTTGNVLVVDCRAGQTAAHVERVLAKASIADDELNRYSAREETGGERVVTGEFVWNARTVLLLDPDGIGIDEMRAVGVPDAEGGLLGVCQEANSEASEQLLRANEVFPCLLVDSCGERYAFRFSTVWEVVECGPLTLVPKAPLEVAGIALLRGNPIPALSLGRLLTGALTAGSESQMVIVERSGAFLGLLVERIAGIERFGEADIQKLLSDEEEIEGYLAGPDGKMTGLLSLSNLLSDLRLQQYRSFMVQGGNRETGLEDRALQSAEMMKMLTFMVGSEHCALPMALVERIEERQPETKTPDSEGFTLAGVVQIHGDVIPVLDLRREMGLGSADPESGSYLVVRVGGDLWALVVDRVERMVEFAAADIDEVKGAKHDYVRAVGRYAGRLYSVLTVEPIVRAHGEGAV